MADTKTEDDLARCDACEAKMNPSTVERRELPGVGGVVMCRNAHACRERAEAAGVWLVYP